MAFNVERDIFEPTRKAIEKLQQQQQEQKPVLQTKLWSCNYCDFTNNFIVYKCKQCGAPYNKKNGL